MNLGRRGFVKSLILGLAGISIYGYIEPIYIEAREIDLNLGFGKKILFITDTHLHGIEYLDDMLLSIISRYIDSVDLILLGGDQYDELTPELKVMNRLLELIGDKNTYYVNGNHEHWSRNRYPLEEVEKYYREYGLEPLNNRGVWIDNIKVGGVDWIYDDPSLARMYVSRVGDVDILVSHTPDTFSYVREGYKLLLAGHTHGGQILNGFLWTNSRVGYVSGLYRDGDRIMYLSRGAGEMIPIRLFTPREITILNI
ncbi:MAG TPA: metallophosphoesterase [Thermoprotei archaeon]|nr:metallophosphoesterase [Thermoprotei archaeon]